MPVTPGPATPTSAGLVQVAENDGPLPMALGVDSLGRAADLPGAQAATRYVGGTDSGSPTTGTFAPGDFVVDGVGEIWVCTTAGTPGTWVALGEGAALGPASAVIPDPMQYPTLLATTPTPPTTLAAGTYHVGYCYTTADGGRTKLSKTTSITITAGQGIQVTTPMLPSGASGIELYVDDCVSPGVGNTIQGGGSYGQFTTQSLQGGGSYGQFLSQSLLGGGSVSGISVTITSNNDGNYAINFGCYVKLASLPPSDTILFDFNFGANGYFRSKVTNVGHIVLESMFHGVGLTNDLTPTTAVLPSVWYWVAGTMGNSSPVTQIQTNGQVIKGDGTSVDGYRAASSTASNVVHAAYTGTLGWGVSLSNGSGYQSLPSTAEISKMQFSNSGLSVPGAPASDLAASGQLALYLCRGTVGSSVCADSTTNHYDLVAGPNGMVVAVDGPYP